MRSMASSTRRSGVRPTASASRTARARPRCRHSPTTTPATHRHLQMPFRDRSRHVTTRRGEMSSTTPPTSEAYQRATTDTETDHSDESRFEFGPEVVEQTVADAPELDRTALDKLSTDQRALLTELLEGFDSRADVLRWMAALTIQTLGVLDDAWYRSRATDSPTMSYLLGEPWGLVERDVDEATAREVRRGMAALD